MSAPTDDEVIAAGAALGARLLDAGLAAVTAESCTGGLVARALTETAGSSAWFERGFVTYSNDAKRESLGVDEALLRTHGAVSEAVARAMAGLVVGAPIWSSTTRSSGRSPASRAMVARKFRPRRP